MQQTFDQLPAVPATAKQRNYIAVLMDDMGWHSEQMAVYASEQGIDLVSMSMAQASGFIDGLKRLAHPAPKQADDDEDFFDRPPPNRTPTRARVQCLVCGHEARIPILADAKICDTCLADLPAHKDRIEYELECAADRSFNADLDLHSAISDASEKDRQRYQNAVALREANDPRLPGAWATALAAGGSFAVLLRADDAQRVAEQALVQALAYGQVALEEIGKVRK